MSISEPDSQVTNENGTSSDFIAEVKDATLVLDYATANGVLGTGGRKLDDDLITRIKAAQDLIVSGKPPSAEERATFEQAYRDLAIFVSPVTAETLKATSEDFAVTSRLFAAWGPRPIAIIWSRKLSLWAILFIVVAIADTLIDEVNGPLPDPNDFPPGKRPTLSCFQTLQALLQILIPFTYGAIGASVALLKACQAYIHMRQFDPRRIPEYYNRMILGAISGGMIVLLVNQIAGDDGIPVKLSAAALGFLAGYNNDLLFGAIERISAAILPKVGIGSVARDRPPKSNAAMVHDVSLKDLLERLKSATDPNEKKVISDLIGKIQSRI